LDLEVSGDESESWKKQLFLEKLNVENRNWNLKDISILSIEQGKRKRDNNIGDASIGFVQGRLRP